MATKKKKKRTQKLANFASQRMSIAVLVLIMVVTCGVFSPVWFMMRRQFLDSLRSSEKIGPTLPVLNLVFALVNIVVAIAMRGPQGENPVSGLTGLATGITSLVLVFRARGMIQQHVARGVGFYTQLSGVATFFLGCIYLQYKINEIADGQGESPDIDASTFD